MIVLVKDNYEAMSKAGAQIVARVIRSKQNAVIGLATGSTPIGLYKELIRLHKEEGLSFAKVTSFNLDEYVGLPKTHNQSYFYFMWENLFKHIDINLGNIHLPDGMAENVEDFCEWYENRMVEFGGIDVQVLGIGSNGHIAFNEPGSSLGSRTRRKSLTDNTIKDNARFFKSASEVPTEAITMGIGTVLEAREIILLANGKSKAEAVKATIEGPLTAMVPASAIQLHPASTVIVDKDAASGLTKVYKGFGDA